MDGFGVCGFDDLGNPCSLGRVTACAAAKVTPLHFNDHLSAKEPMVVKLGFDYERLAMFVSMCGGGINRFATISEGSFSKPELNF
jgi:hypothetical protein